jgi:hypothetical protein
MIAKAGMPKHQGRNGNGLLFRYRKGEITDHSPLICLELIEGIDFLLNPPGIKLFH